MNDVDFYRRKGTAMRTITDAPQVPSQDVSIHQATDNPAIWGEVNPPLAWRRALPIIGLFAMFAAACVGLFMPFHVARGIGAALVVIALMVAWRMAR